MRFSASEFDGASKYPWSHQHDDHRRHQGAHAARRFLHNHRVPEDETDLVWDALALHTTPVFRNKKKPVVQLVTAGVALDVLGFAYDEFTEEQRLQVVNAHPRLAEKTSRSNSSMRSTRE